MSVRKVLLVSAITLFSAHATAEDDKVVQLKDDPYRRVVFENAVVRVWEVKVPVGESTPFHEHNVDQVSVRINSTVLTNVPKGGLFSFTRDFTLESGSVSYADYTGGTPYIHKITPKGNAHHVIEAEILSPRRKNDPRGPGADRPGATIVVDNYRLRAARLSVEPDKSASIAPNGNTFVVVVKGGQAKGLRTGDVEWYGEPSARSVRNDGSSAVELVEIHVK